MRWLFPYLEACEFAGDQVVESGDLLGLEWRGALMRPRLAPIGEGLRAIVTHVSTSAQGSAIKSRSQTSTRYRRECSK
jgi:hypothetical protein